MRVLFVHLQPTPTRLAEARFPLGVATLAAICKQRGHKVRFHTVSAYDEAELTRAIESFDAQVVSVTTSSHRQHTARRVADLAGVRLHRTVIMGGVHPSVAPDDALSTPGVAAICRGEGDEALPEWLDLTEAGQDASRTPNFWTKLPCGLVRTELRPALQDLDALPWPDRQIIPYQNYLDRHHTLEIEASRGWPFHGGISANPSVYTAYGPDESPVRFRRVSGVLEEIDALRSAYRGIRQIRFQDDCFGGDRQWLETFATAYASEVGLPFICNLSAAQIDPHLVAVLKRAGCRQARVGVESGSEFISHEILNRNATNREVERAFRWLHEAGIETWAFSLIGLPYESEITIEQTLDLNRRIRPDVAHVDVFVPLPGTRAYDLCREEGWFGGQSVEGPGQLSLPSLSQDRLAYYERISGWRIMHPKLVPLVNVLCRIPVSRRRVLYDVFCPILLRLVRRPRQQVLAGLRTHLATI